MGGPKVLTIFIQILVEQINFVGDIALGGLEGHLLGAFPAGVNLVLDAKIMGLPLGLPAAVAREIAAGLDLLLGHQIFYLARPFNVLQPLLYLIYLVLLL